MDNQVLSIIKTQPRGIIRWRPVALATALIVLATSLVVAQPGSSSQKTEQPRPETEPIIPDGALAIGRSSGYVDGGSTCPFRTGDPRCVFQCLTCIPPIIGFKGPFKAVGEGGNGVAPGGVLSIKSGTYREAVFLNKRMNIQADGGPVTISPPPLAPFDLVVDKLDANALPLNPKWGSQLPPRLTPPDPDQCPETIDIRLDSLRYHDPGRFPCTNQFTYKQYGSHFLSPVAFCGPHINWFGATYEGCVEFGDHHTDDDYSIRIRRPDQAGYTPANTYLKGEFDAGETANHFASPWWNIFHSIVENGSTGRDRAQEMFDYRKSVIATALMGIDVEHGPHVELHPVWALAMNVDPYLFNVGRQFVYELNGGQVSPALAEQFRIHDWPLTPPIRVEVVRTGREWKISDARTSFTVWNDDRVGVLWVHGQLAPDNDTWAFFVRNWGNEGYCGTGQEFINFPNNRYTFRLPWRPGATSVRVIPGQAIAYAYNIQNPAWSITAVPGQAVIVTFDLEAPRANGSLYEGELHLQWSGPNVTIPPCAEFSTKRADWEEAEHVEREDEYTEREEAEYAALKKKAQENVKWEGIVVKPQLDSSVY